MADRAVLAGDVLVREHHIRAALVLLVLVGAAGEVDHLVAFDAAGARVDRVRADRGQVVQLERENFPCLCASQANACAMLARVDVREKRLEPVGEEFHRPAQHHRERRGRHLVGIHVHLDAVRAADVLGDHAHVGLGDAEVAREDVLHHVRRLRRVVHGERMLGGVVVGEDGAAFGTHAGVAAEVEGVLHHHVGPGEDLVHAAGVVLALEADVVPEIGVNHLFSFQRFFHLDNYGQFFPLRLDQLHRVLGLRARLGDDRGAGFALPAGALDGDRVLRRRLDALQVREHRDPGRAVLRHRATVEDRRSPRENEARF